MRHRDSVPIVVGVDVGGVKKGFHAVALCDRQLSEKFATLDSIEMVEWCRELDPFVVGIDAPCCWSRTGRARLCERELTSKGIHAFATPSQSRGESHKFYQWMHNGAELFRVLAPHYRLFDGQPSVSSPMCFETFPQAVARALARKTLSAKQKRTDRSRLLCEAGISITSLTNIDYVDAALCAPTAHHLIAGTFKSYGDVAEGFIVVPKT